MLSGEKIFRELDIVWSNVSGSERKRTLQFRLFEKVLTVNHKISCATNEQPRNNLSFAFVVRFKSIEGY